MIESLTKHSIEILEETTKTLNPDLKKKLKILCRKITGEQLKLFNDDTIIIVTYNKKPIGICCISNKSPESHFENEQNEFSNSSIYLYNYLCDVTYKKYKPSVALMNHIKATKKSINLDIIAGNEHAYQFFKKNGFTHVGEYSNGKNDYKMYSITV
jgi:hypothetical protein